MHATNNLIIMKPTLLLPRYFKIIGSILAAPGIVLGALFQFDYRYLPFLDYGNADHGHIFWGSMSTANFTDEVSITLSILGLLFIGFSKFRNEDEQVSIIRLKSLYWAVLMSTGVAAILMLNIPPLRKTVDFAVNNNLILFLLVFISRLYYLQFRKEEQTNLFYLPYTPFSLIGKITSTIFFTGILIIIVFNVQFVGLDFLMCLILPAILIWIWSKEKVENSETEALRLWAMQLSIYVNCFIFIVLTWAIYGLDYILVQGVSLVSVQLSFIIIFYFLLYRSRSANTKMIAVDTALS
jgi:hypothetical protein